MKHSPYYRYMVDDSRTLLVFPDTNVLIQGRPLRDIPWSELGRPEIELIICGPVIRELDRLKNKGGRAGKAARAMSTVVRGLMAEPTKSDVIHPVSPRVVRRLISASAARSPTRVGLDLNHDDQAIINQALASLDAGEDAVLLTDDNFAAMTAEEFGLPVMMLPAHWLKQPEADDSEKEIARRDAEIARLRATEPQPVLQFVDDNGTPLDRLDATMPRYVAIKKEDVDRLVDRIAQAAPLVDVRETPLPKPLTAPRTLQEEIARLVTVHMPVTPVTAAEIEQYQADYKTWLGDARAKIAEFHIEWNRRRDWPRATLEAVNVGSRPANSALLEIEAAGRFVLSKASNRGEATSDDANALEWLSLRPPPKPPRPRTGLDEFHHQLAAITGPVPLSPGFGLRRHDFPSDADAFFWRSGRDKAVRTLEITCKTWRHGRVADCLAFQCFAGDTADLGG